MAESMYHPTTPEIHKLREAIALRRFASRKALAITEFVQKVLKGPASNRTHA